MFHCQVSNGKINTPVPLHQTHRFPVDGTLLRTIIPLLGASHNNQIDAWQCSSEGVSGQWVSIHRIVCVSGGGKVLHVLLYYVIYMPDTQCFSFTS